MVVVSPHRRKRVRHAHRVAGGVAICRQGLNTYKVPAFFPVDLAEFGERHRGAIFGGLPCRDVLHQPNQAPFLRDDLRGKPRQTLHLWRGVDQSGR